MGGIVRRSCEVSGTSAGSIERMRTWAPIVMLLAGLLAACDQGPGGPTGAVSPDDPAGTSTAAPSETAGATSSASPGKSPAPEPVSPPGVPSSFGEDVPARELPIEELIPVGDEVTGVDRATTDAGEAVVIAFATPGPDPFRQARGFVVWRREAGADPPWRTVYGLAHGERDGVLAIAADTTDLTDDGSDDALVREETGGTGACATYRVIDLAAASSIWQRSLCDTQVQPNPDPIGIYVVARVYGPQDPHCCPSAISERVLAWRGGRFVVVSEQVTDL
jgi:hypothetical protein